MGKVYLVGAGPGDPELLTIKAVRILSTADVVLYDGLVSKPILEFADDSCVKIDIGKRCGQMLLRQDEINALLVQYSTTFTNVVRLKGGDPSVFGRSGEEIAALAEANVEYEIVPGITTALAAAAAARISLTDRRFASSVTLMTAHRGTGLGTVEWNRLVTSGSTIAIYMPGRDYRELRSNLVNAGVSADTPCVIVSCATLPNESTVFTTVGQLASLSALDSPTHVVVGRCANPLDEFAPNLPVRRSQASSTQIPNELSMENLA